MARIVLKDAVVVVDSVDLSDYVRSVTINYEAEIQEATTMKSQGAKEKASGLTDWTAELELEQDFDTGAVDATLFPLVGADAVPVSIKPTAAATGPSNPEYSGHGIVRSYPPISGKVGDLATTRVQLEGSGLLQRKTS